MRKRKKSQRDYVTLCVDMFFCFSFLFATANGRDYLIHLHCRVQRAPSTLNLAHTDKIATHFNHFSLHCLVHFFLFTPLCCSLIRQPIERMQHIQFQFCLLSILFGFAFIFLNNWDSQHFFVESIRFTSTVEVIGCARFFSLSVDWPNKTHNNS